MNTELEGVVTITSKEELHQDEVGQNMDLGEINGTGERLFRYFDLFASNSM